ncbi:hypothetical protein QQF64_007931 [Cirrhinus molitorella]|uniref:Uncharacterized protein n=1 Tax=Cirrhinus molitorella TaxID=172907 RepID=A0ABR3M4P9_9TELE
MTDYQDLLQTIKSLQHSRLSYIELLQEEVKRNQDPAARSRICWDSAAERKTVTKMVFIKKEREDAFSLKREDTEEQTDLMALKEENETSLGKRPQLQITRKSIQHRAVTKQRPKALKPVPVIQFSLRSFPKDIIADRSPTNQEPHRSYAEASPSRNPRQAMQSK